MEIKQIEQFQYLNDLIVNMLEGKKPAADDINMSGTRKSGKTVAIMFFFLSILLIDDITADMYMLRYKVEDAGELFDDLMEWAYMTEHNIFYHQTKRYIKYINKTIRVLGAKRNTKQKGKASTKSGLKSGKGKKYGIVFFEEATEFPADEINAILEAVRGYKYLIVINAANPWSIKNWFVAKCNKNQRYSENELLNKGYQFLHKGNKVFHYSNWVHNKYLAEWEKRGLTELWDIDPIRARISSLGMPGIADGTIYAGYHEKIKDTNELPVGWMERVQEWTGGIDWGLKRDATSASVWAVGYKNEFNAGLDLYRHSNVANPVYKSNMQMVSDIIDFYQKNRNKYNFNSIEVKVDNSAHGIIEMLNQESNNRGAAHWLYFIPSNKYPIIDRIDCFTLAFLSGIFYIDKRRMRALIDELEIAVYEDNITGKRVRVDQSDHSINDMEYALAEFMYSWAPEWTGLIKEKL